MHQNNFSEFEIPTNFDVADKRYFYGPTCQVHVYVKNGVGAVVRDTRTLWYAFTPNIKAAFDWASERKEHHFNTGERRHPGVSRDRYAQEALASALV